MSWLLPAVLSALFASLVTIFAKVGIKGVDSNLATLVRTLVILPFIFFIVLAQGHLKEISSLSKTTLIFLVLSGLATGLSWLFYFRALQIGDVHKVVPIDKLSFVLSILLGVLVFHEKISAYGIVGIVLLVLGTLLVVFV